MNKNKWKKSEDHILEAGIMKYGIHKWHKISSLIGRPPLECKKRWFEFLSPDARKEWDEHSISELMKLSKIFNNQWELVGKKLGRSGQECYEKYGEIICGYTGYKSVEHKENTDEIDTYSVNLVKARLLNTKSRKALRKECIAQKKDRIYNLNIKKRKELGVSTDINCEDVLRNVKCFDKVRDKSLNKGHDKSLNKSHDKSINKETEFENNFKDKKVLKFKKFECDPKKIQNFNSLTEKENMKKKSAIDNSEKLIKIQKKFDEIIKNDFYRPK
ncbi:Cell division cycle 5-like protein [Dictyocoela muelleri]|nr:Cell division cycle 5-like protein [Dictyocoela muelleri]